MKRFLSYLTAVALTATCATSAATVDEARQLAEDGDINAAISMLEQLEADEPKNAEVSAMLGEMYAAVGRDADAELAYQAARRKGDREATLALAEMANRNYRIDDARKLVEEYRASLKKGKKTIHPDNSGDIDDRIDRTANMLDRVQKIEVIDSLVVDTDEFFKRFRLSPESGSINSPSVLPQGFDHAEPTVVYEPESGRQMIWAAPDTAGNFALYSSSLLFGDEWEDPLPLGDHLGEGGDANYPFLMPDGITLYYANDGENSLGGLDIFISRRDDDGSFLQPQNLGMPYNSPYDDYMLAIDELTGVGWWASDRNRIPGKTTIYVFIPQDLRTNVDVDAPDLRQRALLNPISSTQPENADYRELISRIANIRPASPGKKSDDFRFALGAGKVVTSYSQLHSPRSRALMKQYLEAVAEIKAAEKQLLALRARYAKGDRSISDEILAMEKQIERDKAALPDLRNEIVMMEQ